MYPSISVPTSRPISRIPLRALLVATCAAGLLGCEDQAEPTAAEPPVPTAIAAGSEQAANSGVGVQAITLPVSQRISTTAPAPAFRITQTGTGPNGIFRINQSTNTQVALLGQSNGRGAAVRGIAIGRGPAGRFDITDPFNSSPAVVAASNGLGPAGSFEKRTSSGGVALRAFNTLNGFAAEFGCLFSPCDGAGVSIGTNGAIALVVSGGPSFFDGNVTVFRDVTVDGTLRKSAGSFRIDHPLDPEHRYLQHSFVESPEMLNVYNGNATLDGRGEAIVMLPPYFEALNRDFRYQLTPLGAPGPNLYIAEEISRNRFVIAGGTLGARVSWQVTGVRHDAYAEAHRIQVEEDKSEAERGVALRR